MKSHKFFFAVVAFVIVFLVVFFAVVKPQFFAALNHGQATVSELIGNVMVERVGENEVSVGNTVASAVQTRIHVQTVGGTVKSLGVPNEVGAVRDEVSIVREVIL